MILELTKENLQNAGYTEEEINRLYNAKEDCTLNTLQLSKYVFVSKSENKFYTGIDFWRVIYFKDGKTKFPFRCPDLFNDFYEIILNTFLEQQKKELSIHFDLTFQTKKFILNEIKRNEEIIKEHKDYIERYNKTQWIGKVRVINILETYIQFLDNKSFINSQSKQPEAVEPIEIKYQYTHIFKGKSFEIWQRMFDEFKITKSSRTDIDFMFQIMKYDNLIYDNIGLIDIQNWINETYQMTVEKVKYTNPNSKSNLKRLSTYNLINIK